MKARNYFEILGFAQLLILPFIAQFLYPGSAALLHNRLSFRTVILGLGIDVLAIYAVGIAVLVLVPRLRPMPRVLVEALLTGTLIWWTAVTVVLLLLPCTSGSPRLEAWLDWVHARLFALNLTLPMFAVVISLYKPEAIRAVARGVRFGLAAFSTCALWIVPKLFELAFLQPVISPDRTAALPHQASSPRIVWIMMDELSQELAMEHPPEGITLPNFARLRAQSVGLDNITDVGEKTEEVIPALLAGMAVDKIRSTPQGNLEVERSEQHEWRLYDVKDTLFGMAHEKGWPLGVVGWYNPYCRIFQSVVSSCSWTPGIQGQSALQMIGASGRQTAVDNALVIPRFFFEHYFWRIHNQNQDRQRQNLADYQRLEEKSEAMIGNDKIRFVFLHLPVPHPPGLYDRRTHQLCACGNYFDNLGLADETLGKLLGEIDATRDGGRTTVIVSSDHSWRTWLWRTSSYWTEEEERVAQHFSDARPVFLVRFAGQQQRVDVAAPVPELAEHDLIAGMLEGKITSAEELVRAVPAAASAAARTPGLH